MSEKSAVSLYDDFVTIIDKAAAAKRIYDVPEAAERVNMKGGGTQRGLGQRWEYSLTDSVGKTVLVKCRWWDQSKAFSIQPDMHVMSVELLDPENPMSYEQHYEE